MEFTNKPVKWDNVGVEPPETLKSDGFVAGYKPPAAYFNFLFNNYYKCMDEMQKASVEMANNTPTVKYINDTIASTLWSLSGDKYVARKSFTGYGDVNVINVYFSKDSLQSAVDAGILPVTMTENGVVTIYATSKPGVNLTATFELVKGGAGQ